MVVVKRYAHYLYQKMGWLLSEDEKMSSIIAVGSLLTLFPLSAKQHNVMLFAAVGEYLGTVICKYIF
jgi:hypothetical protein